MLQRIFSTEGGSEALDVLMKYLFVPHAYFALSRGHLFIDRRYNSDPVFATDTKEWPPRVQAKVLIEVPRLRPKVPASHK